VFTTTHADLAFDRTDVAILLGGFPRKPGMERKDLISQNAAIMIDHGASIEKHASRDVKVLVIANPANTNCLLASQAAPSIPTRNFTCLTRLDHDRLRGMIAKKLNELGPLVDYNTKDVRGVAVFGNHSTTQVAYLDSAEVCVEGSWVPVKTVLGREWLENTLPEQLQQRGAEIISHLQASSAMSAARAIVRHLSDWIGHGAGEDHVFSMGVRSDGNSYGVPDGLVCSFPCTRAFDAPPGEYTIVSTCVLSQPLRAALHRSVEELEMEKETAFKSL